MATDKHASVYYDREAKKFQGINSQVFRELESRYDGIDIESELKKMGTWLMTPKGMKRKGTIGFILKWLNNHTPMPPTTSEELDIMQSDTPLGRLVREYLMDLWKDKEHILEFNTIRAKR
jgi:hypothetical protein